MEKFRNTENQQSEKWAGGVFQSFKNTPARARPGAGAGGGGGEI